MSKNRPRILSIFIAFLLPVLLLGQGTYYNSIDTGAVTFVTDLHSLIYPHTKISYDNFDETNIANFASRDTTGGQKVVTCVYSGENFVYTPPFAWTTFSREHTWCHSWMPTYSSTSGPEYSDQHHLFPTNQNNANGRRSNHPLGEVTSISYQYLEGKLGTNELDETVYEPRDSQKGDAARALFYMAVCYNGVNGNDWSFNYLNTVTLPGLTNPEPPQSLEVLLQWHEQDPPDDWERARNEYIYSIQNNRNPFVDYPTWIDLIDFNTLTKKTTATLADEPTNYPNGFGTPTITSSSITVTWTDPAGEVLPTGYLLYANTTGTFSNPTDGTVYSDDSDLSDGSARVNVAYGTESYAFSGLSSSTNYSFRLIPYNGNDGARNYKTASFPSGLTETYTTGASATNAYIEITSTTFTYSQSFNVLSNTGSGNIWNNSTTIPGWYSNKSTYNASTGSATTGTAYSYGAAAEVDRSAGSLASNASGSIQYAVRFMNNSGTTITTIPLRYTGEQWRNGGNASAQSLTFEYKINATSINDATGWIPVSALDFVSPIASVTASAIDGNSTSNKTTLSSTISVTLLNGDEIWFRWTDINDSGSDHGLSFDDFSFNPNGTTLPVELTSFIASVLNNHIHLRWSTATETNNYGFYVERKEFNHRPIGSLNQSANESMDQWNNIGFVEGHGTTNAPNPYSFIDGNSCGTVAYRLKQIDRDGLIEYSQIVEVTVPVPQMFSLEQNYPNPFNAETHISYSLISAEHTTLKIFNTIGQEVSMLVQGFMPAGKYTVPFNASHLSGGIYFYTLRAGKFTETKKLLLVK